MKDTLKFSSKLLICVLLVALLSFFVAIVVGSDSPELVVVDAEDQIIEYNDTPVSIMGNICSGAMTFFLCVMIYHYSWEQGYKDYNREYSKVSSRYILKGFVSGLIAIIPILIIGALSLGNVAVAFSYIYKIVVAPFIYWYNKMLKAENYIFCQFIYIIVPVVSGISYIMGKHSFMPGKSIVYGNSRTDVPVKATSAMDIMNEKNRKNLK